MIVKPFAPGNAIERLTSLLVANAGKSKTIETEIRKVRAGLKGEQDAARYIDTTLAASENWAVIHNLRLEGPYHVSQFDHVLISRALFIYVLETKHFRDGLKITDEGEFLRWSEYERTYKPMESPLMQCDRHEQNLKNYLAAHEILPRRLGMRTQAEIKSLVLVNPEAKLFRSQKFDTSRVVKADQFFPAVQKDIDKVGVLGMLGRVAQLVSASTLRDVATILASHDRPIEIDYAGKLGIRSDQISAPVEVKTTAKQESRTLTSPTLSQPKGLGRYSPHCKKCPSKQGEIAYGKFGYYWKCHDCGGNTALDLPKSARLRKEGPNFHLTEEGKEERLFHVNQTADAAGTR